MKSKKNTGAIVSGIVVALAATVVFIGAFVTKSPIKQLFTPNDEEDK